MMMPPAMRAFVLLLLVFLSGAVGVAVAARRRGGGGKPPIVEEATRRKLNRQTPWDESHGFLSIQSAAWDESHGLEPGRCHTYTFDSELARFLRARALFLRVGRRLALLRACVVLAKNPASERSRTTSSRGAGGSFGAADVARVFVSHYFRPRVVAARARANGWRRSGAEKDAVSRCVTSPADGCPRVPGEVSSCVPLACSLHVMIALQETRSTDCEADGLRPRVAEASVSGSRSGVRCCPFPTSSSGGFFCGTSWPGMLLFADCGDDFTGGETDDGGTPGAAAGAVFASRTAVPGPLYLLGFP
ncbi:hypothetical protein MRX96_054945 [Rhipicephalus microplus]